MLHCRKAVPRLMPTSYSHALNLYLSSNQLHWVIRPSNHCPQSRKIGSIAKIKELGKPDAEEEVEDDLLSSFTKRRGGRTKKGIQKMSPKDWLLSEDGLQFRNPTVGRTNWLGDEIPFPTNPWFKPKPPLSDKSRTKVYESFKQRVNLFVQKNSLLDLSTDEKKRQEQILIRETSEQWGICRDRISAIIRLKAMEDSWLTTNQNEEAQSTPTDHRRTLQLNFEKGMESVLGVQSDRGARLNEDIRELANRRLERKSKFYGTQFVPLDDPPKSDKPISPESTTEPKPYRPKNKYQEPAEPTETRHVIGRDGLPRPSTSYISKPPGKVPMVFTDVSRFPRAPKPMSKAKAKYYPKTSLLPDYQAIQSTARSTHRSHSTIASSSAGLNQSILNNVQFSQQSSNNIFPTDQRERIEEEKKNLAFRLLRQLKGCSNSENGLKILNELGNSPEGSKFIQMSGIDPDEIKEKLLLQAGGLSFKTSGDKSMTVRESNYQNTNSPSTTHVHEAQVPLSKDEKQIRSIKFDMIKSIYLKKLELNSSGRLLLPKSIRSKEEKDLRIIGNASSITTSQNDGDNSNTTATISGMDTNKKNQTGSRSNRMIRQCMKGPLGRLKQRQNFVSSNS